jgi:hypothetical protein
MKVQCQHCGATYETDAAPAAIREVAGCQECGVTALVLLDDDQQADDAPSDFDLSAS